MVALATDFSDTGTLGLLAARVRCRAFRSEYPRTELRILTEDKLHDRYILWDGSHGVTLGHSIKDLGDKDTQVTFVRPRCVGDGEVSEKSSAVASR